MPETAVIRLLLVDDHAMLRAGQEIEASRGYLSFFRHLVEVRPNCEE